MHINEIDLNLLRLFDTVQRTGNVSRAAEALNLTQPAASQGLSRLRGLLHDPLFVRAAGGVAPTQRAQRMAGVVRRALAALEQTIGETGQFDPLLSRRSFRLHMSDIVEGRFLPELRAGLRQRAQQVRLETAPPPVAEIAAALDSGRIDLAVGYLPEVRDTQRATSCCCARATRSRAGAAAPSP